MALRVCTKWPGVFFFLVVFVFGCFVFEFLSLGPTEIDWKSWKERQASGR